MLIFNRRNSEKYSGKKIVKCLQKYKKLVLILYFNFLIKVSNGFLIFQRDEHKVQWHCFKEFMIFKGLSTRDGRGANLVFVPSYFLDQSSDKKSIYALPILVWPPCFQELFYQAALGTNMKFAPLPSFLGRPYPQNKNLKAVPLNLEFVPCCHSYKYSTDHFLFLLILVAT